MIVGEGEDAAAAAEAEAEENAARWQSLFSALAC